MEILVIFGWLGMPGYLFGCGQRIKQDDDRQPWCLIVVRKECRSRWTQRASKGEQHRQPSCDEDGVSGESTGWLMGLMWRQRALAWCAATSASIVRAFQRGSRVQATNSVAWLGHMRPWPGDGLTPPYCIRWKPPFPCKLCRNHM